MATLVGLLGASDNLDETQPVLNRQDAIIGLSLSFLVLTWLCVLFRFYTRFFIMKSPWWDDLFVLLSVVSPRPGSMLRSPCPCVYLLAGLVSKEIFQDLHKGPNI